MTLLNVRKNTRTAKCDKSTVTCNVSIMQCKDGIIKCDVLVTCYSKLRVNIVKKKRKKKKKKKERGTVELPSKLTVK